MLHKFGSDVRFPLTAAFSLSAVLAAMVSIAPSAQAQTACVGPIPADPVNGGPTGTPSATCSQYFSAGATFPLLLNRQFFDYYGISIPTGSAILPGQPGAKGYQTSNPSGSPRNTNQQFNYCGTGSGNGRAIFTGVPATSASSASCSYATAFSINGSGVAEASAAQSAPFPTNVAGVTPLFAGTDSALAASDITNYTNTELATRGNPIQIPTVFGAIVGANNPSLGNLALTTLDLCRIFDGTYTNYSQLSTPGVGTISVFIRSDSSGTTTGLTTYLASACPSVTGGSYYLTAGTNTFPTVPQTAGFTRANGNDLVAGNISTNSGGFGYLEASFGQPYATTTLVPGTVTPTPAPFIASLQNPVSGSFIFPTPTTINRDLTGVTLSPNTTYPCVLSVAGLPIVPTVGNAYPIVSTTYTLAYTRYPSTAEASAVRNVYNFILGNRSVPLPQANDQIAQGLGFSVLNSNSTSVVTNTLRGSARACLTGITSP